MIFFLILPLIILFVSITNGAEVLWEYTLSGNLQSTSKITADENGIYIKNDYLQSVDFSGNTRWSIDNSHCVYNRILLNSSSGHVYNVCNYLMSYNSNGEKSTWPGNDYIYPKFPPAVSDKGVVYIPLDDGNFGLEARSSTGQVLWQKEFFEDSRYYRRVFTPVIGFDDTVYVQAYEGDMYALDENGETLWVTGPIAEEGKLAIGKDRKIYGTANNNISCIDPDTGALIWQTALPGTEASSPILRGDGVVLSISADRLYALNSDGDIIWSTIVVGAVGSPLIGKDRSIYVLSSNGLLSTINTYGHLEESDIIASALNSDMIMGLDGTIYVVGTVEGNTKLIAVSTDSNGLAEIGWPASDYGSRRSRFQPYVDLGSITGTVLHEFTKEPLEGVLLETSPHGYSAATDVNGHFSFENIPVGLYQITASRIGSPSKSVSLEVISENISQVKILMSTTGGILWRASTGVGYTVPVAISPNGKLYTASGNNLCTVLSNGILNCTTVDESITFISTGNDGSVYYGTNRIYSNDIYGVNRWVFPAYDWIHGPPTIMANGTIRFIDNTWSLWSVQQSGVSQYRFDVPRSTNLDPLAIANDGTMFVGTFSGLKKYSNDGMELWTMPVENYYNGKIAISIDGSIKYLTIKRIDYKVFETVLHSINSQTGLVDWHVSVNDYCEGGPVTDSSNNVYFACNNAVYAYNHHGNRLWEYHATSSEDSFTSCLVGKQGKVYTTGKSKNVHAIKSDGNLDWILRIDEYPIDNPMTLANDGTLYLVTPSYLYAITTDSLGLALPGWPAFAHDSGKSSFQPIMIGPDSDRDGIPDSIEEASCSDPNDADSDDDGIIDGVEDSNKNGILDIGETNPCNKDTDRDGIQDGTEIGLTLKDIGLDTDQLIFIPDADPTTTTNPLDSDSNNDGVLDGDSDLNRNGKVDDGESDPNQIATKSLQHILLLLLKD